MNPNLEPLAPEPKHPLVVLQRLGLEGVVERQNSIGRPFSNSRQKSQTQGAKPLQKSADKACGEGLPYDRFEFIR